MKRLLRRCSIAVSTLLLLGLAIQSASAQDFSGKVVGIKDGDTIEVMRGGRAVTVRLHGIDTPERGQPFGTRARQHTSDLAFSNVVTVRHRDTDRYGRTVGEVILPDGSSLNAALVSAGLAWWYRQYAPGDLELATLEEEARSSRRGLWADVACNAWLGRGAAYALARGLANITGSAFTPRMTSPPCHFNASGGTARRSSWARWSSVLIAICPSSRASGAPRQK